MVVGPGITGMAQAHAIFGIGPDILDLCDDHKSEMHHPRPGSAPPAAQASRSAVAAAQPARVAEPAAAAPASTLAAAPEQLGNIARSVGGGGGGGVPRSTAAGRSANLPPVPTAPVTRSVVIRGTPRTSAPTRTETPAYEPERVPRANGTFPLAAPPPVPPAQESQPAPVAPPAPSFASPRANDPLAPKDSRRPGRVPDGFRAGYAEYLRAADTTDLVVAALPGVAGIVGFTLVGAYAGYRQARALRTAVLAPVATRVLL